MSKVQVDANGMKALARHAKRVGTEAAWMECALEWIEHADAEIKRLTAMLADPQDHRYR